MYSPSRKLRGVPKDSSQCYHPKHDASYATTPSIRNMIIECTITPSESDSHKNAMTNSPKIPPAMPAGVPRFVAAPELVADGLGLVFETSLATVGEAPEEPVSVCKSSPPT
jgi:hypothetical protein